MEYLIITFRVITIMILFLIITLITGRRKMGEIPVFDFLVFVTLSSVVGADIADPDIKHLPTAYAVVLISLLQFLYGVIIINNRKLGKLLTFEPIVVIENGQLVKGNLKKIKYSIDTILMMLRDKDIFDLSEVEFAIVESTGNLSVLKKTENLSATVKDVGGNALYKGLSVPVIVEGVLYEDNMKRLNITKEWLLKEIGKLGMKSEEYVFFAAMNAQGSLYVSQGKENINELNNLRH